MKAKESDWFSLRWTIEDFYDPIAFEQFDLAPRFYYVEEDCFDIQSLLINEYDHIRLVSIELTTVFVTTKDKMKLPTHYRENEFMPGDSPRYDEWLSKYHKMQYSFVEHIRDKEALQQKKLFLEHTAKIIRHDMHSGINQYIPRGIKTLIKLLPPSLVKKHKLDLPLKMLTEGIDYTQKIYKGVYAFTNLMQENKIAETAEIDLAEEITNYLSYTAYKMKVQIEDLGTAEVQPTLFCVAIDNLIKGGLQFNESEVKWVKIYRKGDVLCIEDNGIGLSKEDFLRYCKPWSKLSTAHKDIQGLDLNIAVVILEDHGFRLAPHLTENGTRIEIDLNPSQEYIIDLSEEKS
jgi:hypothetical protein